MKLKGAIIEFLSFVAYQFNFEFQQYFDQFVLMVVQL